MPARRGTPIVVGFVAIGIVVLLVAKPWGSDPVRTGVAPSTTAVAASQGPGVQPPTPAPTPRPLPSPDIASVGPVDNYSIELVTDAAMARCDYGRPRRGQRYLASIEVQPPVVQVPHSEVEIRHIRSLGWSFELEMSRQPTVFTRDWETVARSRTQTTAAVEGRPTSFTPLSLSYDARADDRRAVFRARVIIEWFTRNLELAGSAEFVMTNYQEGDVDSTEGWSAHCSGAHP